MLLRERRDPKRPDKLKRLLATTDNDREGFVRRDAGVLDDVADRIGLLPLARRPVVGNAATSRSNPDRRQNPT